jgi:prepilin-type N-terminal cleavage/methylation domain-containing protein
MMKSRIRNCKRQQQRGISLVEVLMVLAVGSILTAIAVPQMIGQRRLIRSAGINRDIATNLRLARQYAMSQRGASPTGGLQRVAYTFQYNNVTKEVRIIGPIPAGTAALIDGSYPNNAGSSVVQTVPLTQGGLPASEITYGIPSGGALPTGAPVIPVGALGDGVSMTALSSNVVNITFQPDGSVIDSSNAYLNRALYLYNNKAAQDTASAISVLGASGRVKVWRYGSNANAYAE